jgi:hypothetical protein
MTQFKASVQYGDFKGTSAADRADGEHDLGHFLSANGLSREGEFLLGASVSVGENHGGKVRAAYVKAYMYEQGGHDDVKGALDGMKGPIP